MIACVTLIALSALAEILMPGILWSGNGWKLIVTSLLVGGMSLPALFCGRLIQQGRMMVLMWTGVAAIAAALTLWLILLWTTFAWGILEHAIPVAQVSTIAGCWVALLALLTTQKPSDARLHHMFNMTLTFSTLLAGTLLWAIYKDDLKSNAPFIVALAVLTAAGTLLTVMLSKVAQIRPPAPMETLPSDAMIQFTCPRCATSQLFKIGGDNCCQCRLRVDISFEEPRCDCGYPLYKLQSDRCPECGKDIPASQRWAALQHPAQQDQPPSNAPATQQPSPSATTDDAPQSIR